jgi:tetratricopeptide (TPR) repeat protein
VRINAQLVDAATGGHLWADRYDGDLKDIFSLQDKVLEQIVGSLALTLSESERRRLAAKGTDSIAAHDLYLRGLFQESAFSRDGNRQAMRLYEQALSIDPDYALPYARMANILELNSRNGWSDDVKADLEKAVALAEKAIHLDPQNPYLYWSLGRSVARLRTPETLERGIKALERAIELDPDFADAYAFLAVLYVADGRADDGLRSVETAIRLNPHYPFWYLFMRGMTRYVVKDYESAIADFEAAAERSPTALFVRWWLAASYAQAGRIDDAEWQVDEMKLMGFKGSIETIIETGHIQDPGYLAIYIDGLRKAGIPE